VITIGWPTMASAQSASPSAPVVSPITGEAVYETVPIELRPGAAYIDWTVRRADSAAGCTASASIRSHGGVQPIVTLYAVALAEAGEGTDTGRSPLGGIVAGQYLLDLGGAGCLWTMVVSYEP
jgi:hypothetical protein